MKGQVWVLANPSPEQLGALKEAEQTLGDFNIVLFQRFEADVARLDASQVECLEGLEKKLGLTAVAYARPAA